MKWRDRGGEVKRFAIAMLVLTAISVIPIAWATYRVTYVYSLRLGQYLQLGDDASTATKKLEWLNQYVGAVKTHITRNEARYIFKRERLTRDVQVEVLGTLLTRLQEAARMNPESFEYQTAMQQISGQEFNHVLDTIDGTIWGCWLRQNLFCWICLVVLIPFWCAFWPVFGAWAWEMKWRNLGLSVHHGHGEN